MSFAEFIRSEQREGCRQAEKGLSYSGKTWHGLYAYMNRKEELEQKREETAK